MAAVSKLDRRCSFWYHHAKLVFAFSDENVAQFLDCACAIGAIQRIALPGYFQVRAWDMLDKAPSKRIAALVPGYEKPLLGVLAALQIGLSAMRAECPHCRIWLELLEAW